MEIVIFSKFILNQSALDTELEKEKTKVWLSVAWPLSQCLVLYKHIGNNLQVSLANTGQFGAK